MIGLVAIALAVAGVLISSHRAPSAFALSTPSAGASGSLTGRWKVASGSEVGYRAHEQFINQQSPTEAVARTSKVGGGLQVGLEGSAYVASSIDFTADLSSLVSQDKYATFQTYQRDYFVRSIYLQTDVYPTAEFRAPSASVPLSAAPGPATVATAGSLKVHGVTRNVTTTMQVQLSGGRVEIVGSIAVDMRDFGIDVPDISFTKAQPQVVIEYHLLLVRA